MLLSSADAPDLCSVALPGGSFWPKLLVAALRLVRSVLVFARGGRRPKLVFDRVTAVDGRRAFQRWFRFAQPATTTTTKARCAALRITLPKWPRSHRERRGWDGHPYKRYAASGRGAAARVRRHCLP